eukprot:TRINITY_DN3797_c0_g1_i1.p1 TRINITY_DN3797_c0_g1~~TRINITY_DN3797_c0_g1_i1.p1  ORF type:complete len:141 (-),score=42.79 TRINITY_DN3797_c0_g1_i1:53-439(-)
MNRKNVNAPAVQVKPNTSFEIQVELSTAGKTHFNFDAPNKYTVTQLPGGTETGKKTGGLDNPKFSLSFTSGTESGNIHLKVDVYLCRNEDCQSQQLNFLVPLTIHPDSNSTTFKVHETVEFEAPTGFF